MIIAGTTQIFAHEKKREFHVHESVEIIYYTKGSGILYTENGDIKVTEGCIVVIPAEIRHYTTAESDLENIFVILEKKYDVFCSETFLCCDDYAENALKLAQIIYNKCLEGNNSALAERLTEAYLALVYSFKNMPKKVNPAVSEVKNSILKHFRECDFELKAVIENSGYSADRFRIMFKEAYDMTPLQYLIRLRINCAETLILSAPGYYKVYMLADLCGFSDVFYFSRKYKELKGISPKEFIKQEEKRRNELGRTQD